MGDDGRLHVAFEHRQNLMPEFRAQSPGILIRGIFAPRLTAARQLRAQFVAADVKQWAHDAAFDRIDRSKSRGTCATHDSRQHRFSLIVGGMRDGDVRNMACVHDRREKGVAQSPRRIFKVPAVIARRSGHIVALSKKLEVKLSRERCDKTLVAVRFGSA
jgi:hypothetical protein